MRSDIEQNNKKEERTRECYSRFQEFCVYLKDLGCFPTVNIPQVSPLGGTLGLFCCGHQVTGQLDHSLALATRLTRATCRECVDSQARVNHSLS